MAKLGERKLPVEDRLSDHISIGVLTQTITPEIVDSVIDKAGKRETRVRLLPARVTVYFVLALCIFARESYVEVMTLLVKGLTWTGEWSSRWSPPSDTALVNARKRLSADVFEMLFRAIVKPIAVKKTKGAWFRSWRLVAIDGTILDVADTPKNDDHFGRPSSKGEDRAAFPQARIVGLVECGTHAIFDASVSRCSDSENALTPALFKSLKPGMLCLADRGFWSFELWKQAAATGADLLWRTKSNIILPVVKQLNDGSYISKMSSSDDKEAITVRVIEYRLEGRSNETYRNLSNRNDDSRPKGMGIR